MILILFLWLCPEILKHLRNIPRHRFWCMLKSERVRRLTVFHHASCLGKNCRLKHLRWKHPEKTVQLEDDPFHFFSAANLSFVTGMLMFPVLFLIMKPFPLKSSVEQVDFQQVLQGPKYLKSHWRQWPWSVFLWRTEQCWDLSTKKPTKKNSPLKVNVKEFYKTKRFCGVASL